MATAKFITVKGAESIGDEPFYQGVLQHDRSMTLRETYQYCAEHTGYKPTAALTINSTKVDAAKLTALEVILYGKDATTDPAAEAVDPRLPLPDEVLTILGLAG